MIVLALVAGCGTPHRQPGEDASLVARLKDVVLWETDFRDAGLRCPVAWGQAMYAEHYYPQCRNWKDAPVVISDSVPEDLVLNLPTINIETKGLSLYDYLQLIAIQTGLELRIENGQAIFKQKK